MEFPYIPVDSDVLFRVEILEKIRAAHPNGLLVCDSRGWSWLTIETAKVSCYGGGTGVECAILDDCVRRLGMRMKVFEPSMKSKPGRFYSFTGRRASPLCSYDSITSNGIIRGEKCYCHLPSKVN